jgi:hypothetical protein
MPQRSRRAHPRHAVEQGFVVTGTPADGSAALEGRLLNVSLRGIAVMCGEAPPIGAALELEISREGEVAVAGMEACVVATSPHANGGSVVHVAFLNALDAERLLSPLGVMGQ